MYRCKCCSHAVFQDDNTNTSVCCAVRQSFWICLHPQSLLVASCSQLSDDCVLFATQAAEGKGGGCVPRSVFRNNNFVTGCWGKPERLLCKIGSGYLVSMSICGAALLVILSETWPKFKFFDFHKILKNLLERQKRSQGSENVSFMEIGVDLFSPQAIKQSDTNGSGF